MDILNSGAFINYGLSVHMDFAVVVNLFYLKSSHLLQITYKDA